MQKDKVHMQRVHFQEATGAIFVAFSGHHSLITACAHPSYNIPISQNFLDA